MSVEPDKNSGSGDGPLRMKRCDVDKTMAKTVGAKPGNFLSYRHGLRSERPFTLPKSPKGFHRIDRAMMKFRLRLETLVLAARGRITDDEHCCIAGAVMAHGMILKAAKYLRDENEKMRSSERYKFDTKMMEYTEKRARWVAKLRLEEDKEGEVDFYGADEDEELGDGVLGVDQDGEDEDGDGDGDDLETDSEAGSEGSDGSDGSEGFGDSGGPDFEGL